MLHLLHPVFVHFSVALLLIGGLCEALGLVADRPRPAAFGGTLNLLGACSLLPTIVTGLLARNSVELGATSARLVESHERVGFVILGLWLAALLWKAWFRGSIPSTQRLPYAAYLLVITGLVVYEGFLGGRLVYGHGVGVFPQ